MARHAQRDFLVFEDRTYTYAGTQALALRVAAWGEAQGLKAGDVVLLLMDNRPEFLLTWLGLCKLGVTCALLNTNLRDKSLQHCMNEAKARLIVVGAELVPALATVDVADMPVWVWHGDHSQARADGHPYHDLDAALACWFFFFFLLFLLFLFVLLG